MEDNHSWADIEHLNDLGDQFLRELEEFFVNYHKLSGKQYKILNTKGPSGAWKLIQRAEQEAKQKRAA